MTKPLGCPLTRRQWAVVERVMQGKSQKEVAADLGVSHSTVRTVVGEAHERLGVRTSIELARVVTEAGWLDPVEREYDGDDRLTPGQRLYVDEFMRFIDRRAPRAERAKARVRMTYMRGALHLERDLPANRGTAEDELVPDQLLVDVLGTLTIGATAPSATLPTCTLPMDVASRNGASTANRGSPTARSTVNVCG